MHQDLKSALGKSEWVHGLGLPVGDEEKALSIISEYNAAYARLFAQARIQKLSGTLVPFPTFGTAPPVAAQQQTEPSKPDAAVVKFSAAYAYYREAHGGQRNERAVMQSVNSFLNQYGDADILTLTPRDVQQWINACLDKGQKASTIQRRINALRAIVGRYYRDHEIDKTNPFSKPNVKDANSTSSDRLPFHKMHLKKMDHYFEKAPRLSDDIRRLYLILKLSGARALEFASSTQATCSSTTKSPTSGLEATVTAGSKPKAANAASPRWRSACSSPGSKARESKWLTVPSKVS